MSAWPSPSRSAAGVAERREQILGYLGPQRQRVVTFVVQQADACGRGVDLHLDRDVGPRVTVEIGDRGYRDRGRDGGVRADREAAVLLVDVGRDVAGRGERDQIGPAVAGQVAGDQPIHRTDG
jgi:hypothetical protein